MIIYEMKEIKELCTTQRVHISPCEGTLYAHYSFPAFDNSKTPDIVDGQEIKSGKLRIDSNTILYNKLNVKFRRVWNIKDKCENNAICSTEFIPLKIKSGISQDYLYYHLISDELTLYMHNARKGTSCSQQRIDVATLFNYKIPVPAYNTQCKIANILSRIDERIANNNAINNNLAA